ncbi:MAG: helix-turn-helix domain-containing protein [Infirmifilum sp.]
MLEKAASEIPVRLDKRIRVYEIRMKPHHSVLGSISELPGVTVFVRGIVISGNYSNTLTTIDFSDNPRMFESIIRKLDTNPAVIEYYVLEKKKEYMSLNITKKVCDFYSYTFSAKRFTFFPYVIKKGIRHFYLATGENPRDVASNLSQHGDVVFFERVPFENVLKTTALLNLKMYLNSSLTPSQRSILKEAFTLGYYDWPRKVSLSELAAKFGVSKATLSEHLRRAEQKLFMLFLEFI